MSRGDRSSACSQAGGQAEAARPREGPQPIRYGAGRTRAAGQRRSARWPARVLIPLALVWGACRGDSITGPKDDALAPDAGTWRTWLIADPGALRPPPPPDTAATRAELEEVLRLQAGRTAADEELIEAWRSPTEPWSALATEMLEHWWPFLPDVQIATPVRAARIMALLHVAMYDAMVATWAAKYHYNRPAPSRASKQVAALTPDARALPSYPSEHAAAAAAAAAVLSYAFPLDDTTRFHALARDAGHARILAGAAYPSDVEAGAALGRAVAEQVLAWAKTDGSDTPWTGTIPEGPGMWEPTPPRRYPMPFDPLAGLWRTWVLPTGGAFLPEPHPPIDSPEFQQDLQEVLDVGASLTAEQAAIARYWATDAPSLRWEVFMGEEIQRRRLGPMHAIRARALASVAMYDAFVACWHAKYTYWLARPVTMAPGFTPLISTPPFPSYPSGHSTQSAAAAEVFAELFPDAAEKYDDLAHEASISRLYGGIHYRFDLDAGHELGRKVGELVVDRARSDGAK
ncbi:MAG TPA: phosphatase PAP2 family protein [Longimicrobiales bacterium]